MTMDVSDVDWTAYLPLLLHVVTLGRPVVYH